MKKLCCLLLSAVLMAGAAVTAFAEVPNPALESGDEGNTTEYQEFESDEDSPQESGTPSDSGAPPDVGSAAAAQDGAAQSPDDPQAPAQGANQGDGLPPPAAEPNLDPGMQDPGFPLPQNAYIGSKTFQVNPVSAKVSAVIGDAGIAQGLFPQKDAHSVVFEAVVLEGELEGTTVSAIQALDEAQAAYARAVKPGDAVYLTLFREDTGTVRAVFSEYRRTLPLVLALAAAALLILFLCRHKDGFKLLCTFAASGALVLYVFLPAAADGSAFLAACLACAGVVCVATLFVYGLKYRTLCAAAASLFSLAAAGGLVYGAQKLLALSGIQSLDLLRICYQAGVTQDLLSVLFAALLLSVTGAVLAAANTAAAGADPDSGGISGYSRPSAFQSGMRHGAAALTPLLLTGGFCALGISVGVAALMRGSDIPIRRMLSDERLAVELIRLCAGVLGLALCVPAAAGLCAWSLKLRRRADGSFRELRVGEALLRKQEAMFSKTAQRLEDALDETHNGRRESDAQDSASPAALFPPDVPDAPTDDDARADVSAVPGANASPARGDPAPESAGDAFDSSEDEDDTFGMNKDE